MRASSGRTRYAVAGWVFAAEIADAPVPNLSRTLTRGFDSTRRGYAGRWGQKNLADRTDDNEPWGHSSRLIIEPVWILGGIQCKPSEDVLRQSLLAIIAALALLPSPLLPAHAADLETTPPPPVAEAPPLPAGPPPAVAVVPGPVVPPCPVVWRCGYWGCGWRPVCGPVAGVYWGGPGWRGGPYWGRGYHWGGYRGHAFYRR
jgi:hypothetical protein